MVSKIFSAIENTMKSSLPSFSRKRTNEESMEGRERAPKNKKDASFESEEDAERVEMTKIENEANRIENGTNKIENGANQGSTLVNFGLKTIWSHDRAFHIFNHCSCCNVDDERRPPVMTQFFPKSLVSPVFRHCYQLHSYN